MTGTIEAKIEETIQTIEKLQEGMVSYTATISGVLGDKALDEITRYDLLAETAKRAADNRRVCEIEKRKLSDLEEIRMAQTEPKAEERGDLNWGVMAEPGWVEELLNDDTEEFLRTVRDSLREEVKV